MKTYLDYDTYALINYCFKKLEAVIYQCIGVIILWVHLNSFQLTLISVNEQNDESVLIFTPY